MYLDRHFRQTSWIIYRTLDTDEDKESYSAVAVLPRGNRFILTVSSSCARFGRLIYYVRCFGSSDNSAWQFFTSRRENLIMRLIEKK